jgi:phosphatidylserine decarboxylase
VFKENSREYTILHTDHFGDVIQMEVGAMFVGRIDNYHQKARVERGAEKGRFLFGGSTIIVLTKKDMIRVPSSVFDKTRRGKEIPVKQGQKIGIRKR